MPAQSVIVLFDVGKTNKKVFLLDEQYNIVWEQSQSLPETTDEEGEPCEDVEKLSNWVQRTYAHVLTLRDFTIKAVNFSAYGASFVHIGKDGKPVAPLYNYLKPYPDGLKKRFYDTYGGEVTFSMLTASPVLGSLNSGMQLYRIKEERPELFLQIQCSLHLPQYLSFLLTGQKYSDITSIGCHTNLWNFSQDHYHEWVYREGIIDKLAPIRGAEEVVSVGRMVSGIGLHDSSAAMIPYLESFQEPFVLISTGTWCISMNPFNHVPLTVAELQKDCLCYISYQGRPVKASRLFAGYEHEQRVKKLAAQFHKDPQYAATVAYNPDIVSLVHGQRAEEDRNFEQAYHRLILDIMTQQAASTQLVLQGTDVKRIFVDGGFARNQVYMHLLAAAFPHIEVFAASIPQATAIGAALAIHSHWNSRQKPGDIIDLKFYK
ncbi:MAG: carbohydrate kinase [Sphingobacteriales bacterium 50-39]|nr:carbohydrate kinase [Sphingobacteriales bacterium]OJW61129.1 MAG: carbohydrate kinase [Sphingobacteriales bacterium 50-39]